MPSARELLLKEGSDSKYGARPLRRALRKLVEDPVSDLFLAGKFHKGDKLLAEAVPGSKELVFHTALEGSQFLLEIPVNAKISVEPVRPEAGEGGSTPQGEPVGVRKGAE